MLKFVDIIDNDKEYICEIYRQISTRTINEELIATVKMKSSEDKNTEAGLIEFIKPLKYDGSRNIDELKEIVSYIYEGKVEFSNA